MKMMRYIKKLDYLSNKISLKIKNDTSRYKTVIGGIISFFTILFSFICCLYFMIRMFKREDITIIHSTFISPFVNITFSNKLPFLLRISDDNSLPYNEDEKLYYITSSIWYGGSNDSSLSGTAAQHSISLNISKCDLDKHFSEEFKSYFVNFENLSSYYCLEPRNYSQTLYGLYGNIYPFSYYSFTLRYCKNTTENNNNCYSIENIEDKLKSPYFDILFIDYTIDALNQKSVGAISVRKERFELSLLLYKRILLYLENIKYITDKGLIFSSNRIENFYRYDSARIDPSLLQGKKTYFATLSIMNSFKSSIYNKNYTKIQDYIAIIGGLIKIIVLLGKMLNYFNSKNSFYLKIIKNLNIRNNMVNSELYKKRNAIKLNSSLAKSAGNILDYNNENTKNDSIINLNKKNLSYNYIRKSVSFKIFPSAFINKEAKHILLFYKSYINKRLNVINILKKLEVIQIPESINKSICVCGENRDSNPLKLINFKYNNFISKKK